MQHNVSCLHASASLTHEGSTPCKRGQPSIPFRSCQTQIQRQQQLASTGTMERQKCLSYIDVLWRKLLQVREIFTCRTYWSGRRLPWLTMVATCTDAGRAHHNFKDTLAPQMCDASHAISGYPGLTAFLRYILRDSWSWIDQLWLPFAHFCRCSYNRRL